MFFNSGRIFRTDYVSLVTAILYVFIFRFIYGDILAITIIIVIVFE